MTTEQTAELATMFLADPLLVGSAPSELGGDISWACWPTYRRQTLAMGGDHMATFQFSADDHILERWLDNYLACHFVETFAGVTTFMGLIWTMRLSYHGVTITRSLDTLFNHVRVRYKTSSSATAAVTSAASNATSLARYGSKQLLQEPGNNIYMNATTAGYFRDNLLAQFQYPRAMQQEARLFGERQQGVLQVEVRGYVHTLNYFLVIDINTGTHDASERVSKVLTDAEFVTEGQIDTNTAPVVDEVDYQPGWERVRNIAELGSNGGARWLAGCYQGRALDYQAADETTIAYEQELRTQRRLTYQTGTGNVIPAPLVQPGGVVFIRDIMGGRPQASTLLDDPRAMFVDMVEYSLDGTVLKGNPQDDYQKAAALAIALQTRKELPRRGGGPPQGWGGPRRGGGPRGLPQTLPTARQQPPPPGRR